MAIDNPPAFLQASSYSASRDRLNLISSRYAPTTLNINDVAARNGFLPGQSGRHGNFSMTNWDVSIGRFIAIIENTFASQPGDYMVMNLATQVLAVTPASPTNNRIDIIGVRVQDAFYSGVLNQADLVVVQGTAVPGTPADPVLPQSFIPILRVTVNAATTTGITADLRKRTSNLGAIYQPHTNQLGDSGTYTGEVQLLGAAGVYPPRLRVWDGAAWRGVASYLFAKPAQTGSGNMNPSAIPSTIMSVSVADPGFEYRLQCGGSLGWSVTAASAPGHTLSLSVAYDTTAWNTNLISHTNSPSLSLAGGAAQPTAVASPATSPNFTGAHTIRTLARNHGATAFNIPAGDPATNLGVLLVPA